MAKNAKLDCFYCPKDKDVQIASHNFLKHTLSKHFDTVLCANSKTAENNRKALKEASKFNPVELKLWTATYYCCFKCNSASVKEASCRHWHFSTEDDDKNHKTEHLQGSKDLFKKVLARMEELKAAPTPAPVEPTPTGDVKVVEKIVEKIVYRDRVVEKIVYKDGGNTDNKETLTGLLGWVNGHFIDEQVSNKLVQKMITDMAECKRLIRVNDIMIQRMTIDLKSGATYDAQKLIEWSEEANSKTKADETLIQNNIDEYKKVVRKNIKTEQVWEEWLDDLKALGVYDEMCEDVII